MPSVYLNGKFAAQRTTGVQRVASRLVAALDGLVHGNWVLLCPAGTVLPQLGRIEVRTVGMAGIPLHLWEQVVLPMAAADGLLVNLAGSSPAFARRQACMIHDAAVFDHPEAYSPLFVAWYRWLFRRMARRAKALLTVSEFSRERLSRSLGIDPRRFEVIANGSDHLDDIEQDEVILDKLGLRGRRFLLAVGSANPTKNLDALVEAFARLGLGESVRLVIVGGSNSAAFAPVGPGRAEGVVRAGPVDDHELKALYGHAVALVFPSLYEGFGLPPLEAMACDCAVIAAQAGSLPEVCSDAALYVDPASIDDMMLAMRRVLEDHEVVIGLRSAGRRRVQAYRWSEAAQRLSDVLARVVDAEQRR